MVLGLLEQLQISLQLYLIELLGLLTMILLLSVILLSMLVILLSIPSVMRHLICGNNLNGF